MNGKKEHKQARRREFIQTGMRWTLGFSLAGVATTAALRVSADDYVWQLDPFKCVYCGRCADYCVMTPSAVKCVHAYDLAVTAICAVVTSNPMQIPCRLRQRINFVRPRRSGVSLWKIPILNTRLTRIYALDVPNVSKAVRRLEMVRCTCRSDTICVLTATNVPLPACVRPMLLSVYQAATHTK